MKKGKADVNLRNDTIAVRKDIIVFRVNDDKDLKRTLPTGTKTNEIFSPLPHHLIQSARNALCSY